MADSLNDRRRSQILGILVVAALLLLLALVRRYV